MIWIRRALVILQVAGGAGSAGQVVVPIHVALRALQSSVGSSQSESSIGVVEGCVEPGDRVVAILASLGEVSLYVIRVGRTLIILEMARDTIGTVQVEIPVDVTLRTLQGGMRAGQRESDKGMVEIRRLPGGGVVASLAGLGEIERYVIRIVGVLEISQMAPYAIGGRAFELGAEMAGIAIQRGVCSRQRESGELQVIKGGAKPAIHAVALLASRREPRGHMARTRGCPEILGMAGIALRR